MSDRSKDQGILLQAVSLALQFIRTLIELIR